MESLSGSSPTWPPSEPSTCDRIDPRALHPDALALQIGDAADVFVPEQLEAAGITPASKVIGSPAIDRGNEIRRISSTGNRPCRCATRSVTPEPRFDIADIGEAVRAQQLFGEILRRDADERRSFRGARRWFRAAPPRRALAGAAARPTAPASDAVVREAAAGLHHRHRKPPLLAASRLQLAFELVQEPPVGAVGDDLLRARLDHADLVQAQGIEADRVLGVVLPPYVVGDLVQGLQRIVVALGEAAIDDQPRGAARARWRTDRRPSEWRAARAWSRPDIVRHNSGCPPACSRNIATRGGPRRC